MDLLGTYLNDHLAGATGGLELARRARDSNEGNEYGELLSELADELAEDREGLKALISELGYRHDHVKVAGGWLGEKAGRLKPNGALLSYSPLSRVVELEGLTVGVTGKRSMWLNLQAAGVKPKSVDLAGLEAQANSQLERLEPLRKRAAAEAFGS